MSSLDDKQIKYGILELRTRISEYEVAAIIGHIRNGANDDEIFSAVPVYLKLTDILLIREAIKRNLI